MSLKTTPYSAAGTTLGYKIPPASVYSLLGQVIELTLPAVAIASIDTTALSATVKSAIPSIPDNGEVTFSCFYVNGDPGVAELISLAGIPLVGLWEVTLPDGTTTGTTVVFSAFLTAFAPKGFAIDDKPVVDVTLKVTGALTLVIGT